MPGKEVLPDEEEQRQRNQGDREVEADEDVAAVSQPPQRIAIPLAEPLERRFEAPLESREDARPRFGALGVPLRRHLTAQQPGRHGRRQGAGQDERGDHREDDRLRERQEQVAGNAAELEQRQPDDADA